MKYVDNKTGKTVTVLYSNLHYEKHDEFIIVLRIDSTGEVIVMDDNDFISKYDEITECCEVCGSYDFELCEDPFELDMNRRTVIRRLCTKCYNDIAGDI